MQKVTDTKVGKSNADFSAVPLPSDGFIGLAIPVRNAAGAWRATV
jgi:hypothetical protein